MYSAAFVCTGAGSTTLPCGSIYAAATGGGTIRKITVENPTTSAVDIAVRRLTTTGTQGASVDEQPWQDGPPPVCTVVQAHSVGPTITAGFIDRYQFPASMAGAAVVWTYEGTGLYIPKGAANGIGIIPAAGTGQLVVVTFQWEEC
jgi:hypothetical protein